MEKYYGILGNREELQAIIYNSLKNEFSAEFTSAGLLSITNDIYASLVNGVYNNEVSLYCKVNFIREYTKTYVNTNIIDDVYIL